MTTYTVFRADDSSVIEGRGLSLREAADALLTADGYAYELRTDPTFGFELFISDGSRNSTRGARNMISAALGGYYGDTEDEVWRKVVVDEWRGYEAMTDEAYDDMVARLKAENEAGE